MAQQSHMSMSEDSLPRDVREIVQALEQRSYPLVDIYSDARSVLLKRRNLSMDPADLAHQMLERWLDNDYQPSLVSGSDDEVRAISQYMMLRIAGAAQRRQEREQRNLRKYGEATAKDSRAEECQSDWDEKAARVVRRVMQEKLCSAERRLFMMRLRWGKEFYVRMEQRGYNRGALYCRIHRILRKIQRYVKALWAVFD